MAWHEGRLDAGGADAAVPATMHVAAAQAHRADVQEHSAGLALLQVEQGDAGVVRGVQEEGGRHGGMLHM